MSRGGHHAAYREALARRIDDPLAPAEEQALEAHLAACGPCRSVAQAYLTQRGLLRGLRPLEPPRDLWARTSTALDLEVTDAAGRPRLLALGSLASVGLVVAVAAGAFGLGPFGQSRPGAATPFPVTPQPIAYLTSQGNQITIYRTQVSEVCPAAVIDCAGAPPSADPVVSIDLAAELAPRDLTLGLHGNLAITARDSHGYAVYSVLALPPADAAIDPSSAGTSATVPPSQATRPPGSGRTSRPSSPPPTTTPGPSASASTDDSATAASPTPLSSTVETGQLEPILSDVIAAGAPAAWSPSGDVLAFSARPADGSVGPDVYVWRVGDSAVHALTTDHQSYFASWAGDRIVVSRLPDPTATASTAAAATPGTGGASAAASRILPHPVVAGTYLLDATTGAATPVPLPDAWLPSVDPTGHVVIYWQGGLTLDGPAVQRTAGALYLADWAALTGIAPATPAASAEDTTGADPSGSERASGAAPAPSATSPSPPGWRPGTTAVTPSSSASAVVTPPFTGRSRAGPSPSTTPSAETTPATDGRPAVAPLLLSETGTRVTDWIVRWAPDGTTYGIWTAALPDADVGLLLVANVGGHAADPLEPTPALRAFSLSAGRVAWIAPDDGSTDGDLRVVTWGASGAGGVNIRILGGATLAF